MKPVQTSTQPVVPFNTASEQEELDTQPPLAVCNDSRSNMGTNILKPCDSHSSNRSKSSDESFTSSDKQFLVSMRTTSNNSCYSNGQSKESLVIDWESETREVRQEKLRLMGVLQYSCPIYLTTNTMICIGVN